jgi:NTE family protein
VLHWQRPKRYSEVTRLTVEHVMASAAIPMLFPAVRVGDEWFGDGGIRLTAPLSPALHLGAAKILTISTRHAAAQSPPPHAVARAYPPPAQVLGVLYNSVFMDNLDEDILRLETLNRLLAARPPEQRQGMRLVDILVIRPSHDLRRLTNALEPRLPRLLRYMTRGLGTRQAASPDFLSLLLFQRDYLQRLVELGEADAEARAEDIDAFLSRAPETVVA